MTPIWTAEMYSLMLAELLERERRAARAFVAHQLQARAARAHERVLGDHEERVDRDQHGREDELQAVHARRPARRRAARRPRRRATAVGRATSGRFFVVVHRVPTRYNGSKAASARGAPVACAVVAQASASISRGEREVGVGEAALRVGGERQAHLVPAVERMSGWWLAASATLGDAVDERDRGGEVRELALAHDRRALAAPARDRRQALLDLLRRSAVSSSTSG